MAVIKIATGKGKGAAGLRQSHGWVCPPQGRDTVLSPFPSTFRSVPTKQHSLQSKVRQQTAVVPAISWDLLLDSNVALWNSLYGSLVELHGICYSNMALGKHFFFPLNSQFFLSPLILWLNKRNPMISFYKAGKWAVQVEKRKRRGKKRKIEKKIKQQQKRGKKKLWYMKTLQISPAVIKGGATVGQYLAGEGSQSANYCIKWKWASPQLPLLIQWSCTHLQTQTNWSWYIRKCSTIQNSLCLSALAENTSGQSTRSSCHPIQPVWCQHGNGRKQQHLIVTPSDQFLSQAWDWVSCLVAYGNFYFFWLFSWCTAYPPRRADMQAFWSSIFHFSRKKKSKSRQCQNHAFSTQLKLERNRIPRRRNRDFTASRTSTWELEMW